MPPPQPRPRHDGSSNPQAYRPAPSFSTELRSPLRPPPPFPQTHRMPIHPTPCCPPPLTSSNSAPQSPHHFHPTPPSRHRNHPLHSRPDTPNSHSSPESPHLFGPTAPRLFGLKPTHLFAHQKPTTHHHPFNHETPTIRPRPSDSGRSTHPPPTKHLQRGAPSYPMTLLAALLALAIPLISLALASPAAAADRPTWRWPLSGHPRVLRQFAPPPEPWLSGHRGIDLGAPPSTPVVAAGPGIVRFAGPLAGRGVVTIEHTDGLRTTYLPVNASVRRHQRVTPGTRLGVIERPTGHCRESCLHWGLLRGSHYLDPLLLLGQAHIRLLPPYWNLDALDTAALWTQPPPSSTEHLHPASADMTPSTATTATTRPLTSPPQPGRTPAPGPTVSNEPSWPPDANPAFRFAARSASTPAISIISVGTLFSALLLMTLIRRHRSTRTQHPRTTRGQHRKQQRNRPPRKRRRRARPIKR
ncbi:M23 family metallopeptidase [Nonomuraea sp. NPDC049129]|uniref:M23 family metallopeptidase n=1 Tax=Nonomuraea sp. NPDC049129 TaxID=3155272 RepID=UPI00340B850C